MSVQIPSTLTRDVIKELAADRDEPEWLTEQRLAAFDALEDAPLPDVIQTPGKRWTDLESLDFEAMVDPLDQHSTTVHEGGDDVVVAPISEAVDEYGDTIAEAFGSVTDPDRNYLTALSVALFTAGTFVYVPEGSSAEDVTIETTADSRSLFSHTLVVAESRASVTIQEQFDSEHTGEDRYVGSLVEVVAGENATVQYGSMQDLADDTYNYSLKRGRADTYGTIEWTVGTLGGKLTRSDVETELEGDSSETRIVGAFYGHEDQHFDVNARVWHHGEHTTADLVTRGVLDDEARSVYEGIQNVGRDAWDTSSFQRENTLMLSDDAEADATPKLIINNHDTEASHSATVGQVDAEDLFYMTTRGVDEKDATKMMVEGFYVPVLEEIAVDELREDLRARIHERLVD